MHDVGKCNMFKSAEKCQGIPRCWRVGHLLIVRTVELIFASNMYKFLLDAGCWLSSGKFSWDAPVCVFARCLWCTRIRDRQWYDMSCVSINEQWRCMCIISHPPFFTDGFGWSPAAKPILVHFSVKTKSKQVRKVLWTRKAPACLYAYGKPRLCINIHNYATPRTVLQQAAANHAALTRCAGSILRSINGI